MQSIQLFSILPRDFCNADYPAIWDVTTPPAVAGLPRHLRDDHGRETSFFAREAIRRDVPYVDLFPGYIKAKQNAKDKLSRTGAQKAGAATQAAEANKRAATQAAEESFGDLHPVVCMRRCHKSLELVPTNVSRGAVVELGR